MLDLKRPELCTRSTPPTSYGDGVSRSLAALALLSLACGGGGLPDDIPEDCGALLDGRLVFQMESGVNGTCQSIGQQLLVIQSLFEAQFGLVEQPWTVLVETMDHVHSQADVNYGGWTDFVTHRISLSQYRIRQLYGHELFHAQLGPESSSHGEPSWCAALSPWELANGLEDERAYLHCTAN